MKDFFQNLINWITIENIQSKPAIGEDFKFDRIGWYFFISPISGIIKIKIIKTLQSTASETSLLRFTNFKLLVIIGRNDKGDLFKLYKFTSDNLELLNELQKKAIEVIGGNKVQISSPGTYKLQLIMKTVNYINNSKFGPYYLFNAIDASVVSFYLHRLSSTLRNVDKYVNDPFYYFMYDLDGFMIYEQYLDDDIKKSLKIGRTYECKVDFINRNSLVDKQLAIKKFIYQ
jgi:hypothetical protein